MVGALAAAAVLVASSAAAAADAPGPRHLIYLHGRIIQPQVRFCALGTCLSENVRRLRAEEGRGPAGRVLSIREASDDLTEPCAPWKPDLDPGAPIRVREIVVATGLAHGFLYRPLPEWVQPALQWATAP